jgi:crotonobetaine/carnitine-CoA ligase
MPLGKELQNVHDSHRQAGVIALPAVLRANAEGDPHGVALDFEDGTSWTRREVLEVAFGAGAVLRDMGVVKADRIAVALPNGADFLRAWRGAATIGAVVVPIHMAFRGELLAHVLHSAAPNCKRRARI